MNKASANARCGFDSREFHDHDVEMSAFCSNIIKFMIAIHDPITVNQPFTEVQSALGQVFQFSSRRTLVTELFIQLSIYSPTASLLPAQLWAVALEVKQTCPRCLKFAGSPSLRSLPSLHLLCKSSLESVRRRMPCFTHLGHLIVTANARYEFESLKIYVCFETVFSTFVEWMAPRHS